MRASEFIALVAALLVSSFICFKVGEKYMVNTVGDLLAGACTDNDWNGKTCEMFYKQLEHRVDLTKQPTGD